MWITKVEPGKGKRYLVYGEDTFLFALYGQDLKRYHIEENQEISDTIISSILDEIIYKRGKERALYLLERRPMTEYELRKKLLDGDYPTICVERVIDFLKAYHYLDDTEYIRMYVTSYQQKKSKRQLIYDLLKKGIAKADVDTFFEENPYSEEATFQRQFERYIRGKDLSCYATRQKVFRYFFGKGYASSLIEQTIRSIDITVED